MWKKLRMEKALWCEWGSWKCSKCPSIGTSCLTVAKERKAYYEAGTSAGMTLVWYLDEAIQLTRRTWHFWILSPLQIQLSLVYQPFAMAFLRTSPTIQFSVEIQSCDLMRLWLKGKTWGEDLNDWTGQTLHHVTELTRDRAFTEVSSAFSGSTATYDAW